MDPLHRALLVATKPWFHGCYELHGHNIPGSVGVGVVTFCRFGVAVITLYDEYATVSHWADCLVVHAPPGFKKRRPSCNTEKFYYNDPLFVDKSRDFVWSISRGRLRSLVQFVPSMAVLFPAVLVLAVIAAFVSGAFLR